MLNVSAAAALVGALPEDKRHLALGSIWPQGAVLLAEMERKPAAIKKCAAAFLPLLFASATDDVLAKAVEVDSRPTTSALWAERRYASKVPQILQQFEIRGAQFDQRTLTDFVIKVIDALALPSLSNDDEDTCWPALAEALARIEDIDLRSSLALRATQYLPTSGCGLVMSRDCARVTAWALTGVAKLPSQVRKASSQVVIATLATMEEFPTPAVFVELFKIVVASDDWTEALCTSEYAPAPLIVRLLNAPPVWAKRMLAHTDGSKELSALVLRALLLGQEPSRAVTAALSSYDAWELAKLCPKGPLRSGFAAAAFDAGSVWNIEGTDPLIFLQEVDALVLSPTIPAARAQHRAATLLQSNRSLHMALSPAAFGALVLVASRVDCMAAYHSARSARRLDLLADCDGLAQMVVSNGDVAQQLEGFFVKHFESAPLEEWQLLWSLLPEWSGSLNELFVTTQALANSTSA